MIPFDPHIPYFSCWFLSSIFVTSTIDQCLSVINYPSPSFVAKFLIFLLGIYLLMSPIKIILSPLLFQVFMLSSRSDKKSVIGNSRLFKWNK